LRGILHLRVHQVMEPRGLRSHARAQQGAFEQATTPELVECGLPLAELMVCLLLRKDVRPLRTAAHRGDEISRMDHSSTVGSSILAQNVAEFLHVNHHQAAEVF